MNGVDGVTLLGRLRSTLELQDCTNSKIRPDWPEANNAWFRAIGVESDDLLDHIERGCWKHQSPDISRGHLELVDMLHFGLSEFLQLHRMAQEALSHLLEAYAACAQRGARVSDSSTYIALAEAFATAVLTTMRFDLAKFCELASAVGMEEQMLYETYEGKNILNGFRQDQRYKAGAYTKAWDDREDNVWLVEFAAGLNKHPGTLASDPYSQLSRKHDEVTCGR